MLLAAAVTYALTLSPVASAHPQMDRDADDPGQGTKRKIRVVIGGSTGVGISYLPLIVIVQERLLEKHAAALSIEVSTQWVRFPRAAAMYEALLAGTLDFAAGAVSQLLAS